MLDRVSSSRGDQFGPGTQAQQRGFGGAQQLGRPAQAHQLEHTHALVQLAARLAQHGRVDRVQVGGLRLLLEVAPQGLVGQLQ